MAERPIIGAPLIEIAAAQLRSAREDLAQRIREGRDLLDPEVVAGQIQVEVKGLMTQVNGDAMLTLKGGITMIN